MVLPQTKLPRREREIMDSLYQQGEATVNEVM
jgi:predicted transcriptional regulator